MCNLLYHKELEIWHHSHVLHLHCCFNDVQNLGLCKDCKVKLGSTQLHLFCLWKPLPFQSVSCQFCCFCHINYMPSHTIITTLAYYYLINFVSSIIITHAYFYHCSYNFNDLYMVILKYPFFYSSIKPFLNTLIFKSSWVKLILDQCLTNSSPSFLHSSVSSVSLFHFAVALFFFKSCLSL